MKEEVWCVQRCVTECTSDTVPWCPPLNHTDGYPVTWVVPAGQTTSISRLYFAKQLKTAENECHLRGSETANKRTV